MSDDPLYYAIQHHAKALQELVGVLALGYALELEPRGWRIVHSGVGPESYSLRRDDAVDPQFHFRYARTPSWRILIKDAWFEGDVTSRITLVLRTDALRFVEHVKSLP
jgi:hypothetical protein